MPTNYRHTLPNGLRLIVIEQPHLHTAAFSYVVRVGSRHESQRNWGLSHFVEHMMFRGSARYRSTSALMAPFERAGGSLAAETWRDHTHFSAVLHPTRLGPALSALGDMMARPAFLDLEAERALIQAELMADLDEDGGDAELCNVSRASLWPNHPLGRRITGGEAHVARFSNEDVSRHHARFYGAKNSVLAISGRVQAKTLIPLLERAFGAVPPGKPARRPQAPLFAGRHTIHAVPAAGSQLALSLAFAAFGETDEDFLALELIASLLDEGMGARLHLALSERSGLVYAYDSGLDCYSDAGLYELELQVAPERASAALAEALGVFETLVGGNIRPQELAQAKERVVMAMELGQDSASEMAQEAALDVLFARPGAAQTAERLKNINLDDLRRVARRVFGAGSMHLTLMGGLERAPLLKLQAQLQHYLSPQSRRRRPNLGVRTRAGHSTSPRKPAVAAPLCVP